MRQQDITTTPTSDNLLEDSKWTNAVTALKQWQDIGGRSCHPQHSVIFNNILAVGCMPVVLDGLQPQQRHAFLPRLAYVIIVELTDSTGLGSVSAGILEVMVESLEGGQKKFAWLDGTFFIKAQVSLVT